VGDTGDTWRFDDTIGIWSPFDWLRWLRPAYPQKQDEWERWGAGVETQKNVRGEIGGWGRVPFNETYAPSLSTIYDGA